MAINDVGIGGADTSGGGIIESAFAPIVNAISAVVSNIESGLAHFVNVIFNNIFYAGVTALGIALFVIGFQTTMKI